MSSNIADRENREKLRTFKAALDRLEGGSTFDIFAKSEDKINIIYREKFNDFWRNLLLLIRTDRG